MGNGEDAFATVKTPLIEVSNGSKADVPHNFGAVRFTPETGRRAFMSARLRRGRFRSEIGGS